MRYALSAAIIAAVFAACVAAAATPTVRLAALSAEPRAQTPWVATLVVAGSNARPTLVARGSVVRSFATSRVRAGRWRARVVLPEGSWRLEARLGGRTYLLRTIVVSRPPPDHLTRPYALALRGKALYVADRDANRVVRIDLGTRSATTVGRAGEPVGVGVGPNGVVHAVSGWDIVRFDDGTAVRVAGNGTRGLRGNGGPATEAQLGGAGGFGFDAAGRLYVAEYDDGVRVVETDGTIRTLAHDLGAPHDLAVAPDGTVYAVETHRNRVVRVARDGTVTPLGAVRAPIAIELAPDGSLLVAGGDAVVRIRPGQASRTLVAGLGTITGLALGPGGELYAARLDGRDVLRIAPNGRFTTFVR
jgi:DNA-binding beta-propeller fold protein YncE